MGFDAIIVGAGIIGTTCARYLSIAGMKVAMVEKNGVGNGTTDNSFGWINGTSKTSDLAYHRLNALGVKLYAELAEEYGAAALGLNGSGALAVVSQRDAAGFAAQKKQARILRDFGYNTNWVDNKALSAMEPNISLPPDAEAMFAPDDMVLDAPGFARFMAGQVDGVVHRHCAAQELLTNDAGVVCGVKTDQGDLKAPRVIVACGPNTPEVLGSLTGYDGFTARFPVNKVPGLILTTPRMPDRMVRHVIYSDAGAEIHMLPDIGGGMRIGSDDIDGLLADQKAGNLRDLAMKLLDKAAGYFPEFIGSVDVDDCKYGVGVRAYPEDGMTIAGAVPGAGGLYVIATHSGVTLAPALGALMSEVIVEEKVPDMLRPFGLERLPGF